MRDPSPVPMLLRLNAHRARSGELLSSARNRFQQRKEFLPNTRKSLSKRRHGSTVTQLVRYV